jgi:hypothetical protein
MGAQSYPFRSVTLAELKRVGRFARLQELRARSRRW